MLAFCINGLVHMDYVECGFQDCAKYGAGPLDKAHCWRHDLAQVKRRYGLPPPGGDRFTSRACVFTVFPFYRRCFAKKQTDAGVPPCGESFRTLTDSVSVGPRKSA